MADTDPYINPQKLASQFPQNYGNPNKFYTQFMYKLVFVSIFLVVVPLFPSQAPEFINQTLHTRSWELVQVLLVGIAVSYGLFSRKNEESEKENVSKFDNAHSYVSRFLQVSSVFDDDAENPTGSDENKVQTWNNQYSRGEPVVVVAQENSVLEEQRGTATSRVVHKPLLLPVRSLKSRVSNPDVAEPISESSGKGGSKRFSSNSGKSMNGEIGGSNPPELVEKAEENVVLPSPIPWRSRSGRMAMKEDIEGVPLYSLPPSMEESEFHRPESRSSFRSSSRSSSASPSPKNMSPSPSFSSESQAKNAEEVLRKKIYYKASQSPSPAPPPPPPPPPLYVRKPPLTKSNSTLPYPEVSSGKEFNRSIRSVPKDLSRNDREDVFQSRGIPGAESRPRVLSDGFLAGKSVRTIRAGESVNTNGKPIHQSAPKTDLAADYETEEDDEHDFVEKKDAETDDEDSDFEYDAFDTGTDKEEVPEVASSSGGPDVNKKADEFIAKFREQIRLQRIESIKRSTGQISSRSSSSKVN